MGLLWVAHSVYSILLANQGIYMEHNRLRWASRRGMLELDLILQPFVEEDYLSLSSEDQRRLQQLLECEDQDLFTWFMRRGEPEDSEMKAIVKVILDARKP